LQWPGDGEIVDVDMAEEASAAGTVRLTVAQAVLRYLAAQHSVCDATRQRLVPGMLGIFGHGNEAGFGEALESLPRGSMFFLEGRNEQAMAHTAAAFARASRRCATLACTASIGPGSLNMATAAAAAHVNRLPVLLFPADKYATRRQGPHLQGLEHPSQADWSVNDCFRPISRYFDRIQRPEQLLETLPAAMRALTSVEEMGPVVISIPQDLQTEAFDIPVAFFAERDWVIDRPAADPDRIAHAASLIRAARRPVVIAGGGVVYAQAEQTLRNVALRLGIPVAETFGGKGVIADGSWRDLGGLGVDGTSPANVVVGRADLVIAAGTRLSDFVTGSRSVFAPDARFVGLNISRFDAAKEGAVQVVGDLRRSLEALADAIDERVTSAEYEAEITALCEEWVTAVGEFVADVPGRPLSQAELIRELNDTCPAHSSVASAAGTGIGELLKFWDSRGDRRAHLEFGFSCMGYELAAAIGERLADPTRESYALVGDGTFLLYPSDLVVARQHGVKITVLISDNDGMQSIRRLEGMVTDSPYANVFHPRATDTRVVADARLPLDYVRIAEGMGVRASRATTRQELRSALVAALDDDGPTVIVVPTDPSRFLARGEVWLDIAPAEVSSSSHVTASRTAYDERRAERQPVLHGPRTTG
jgi:3D-(3,5/4)-trihydroxycyclohexane-1,2-dione acylhydrolase (decyclizing)